MYATWACDRCTSLFLCPFLAVWWTKYKKNDEGIIIWHKWLCGYCFYFAYGLHFTAREGESLYKTTYAGTWAKSADGLCVRVCNCGILRYVTSILVLNNNYALHWYKLTIFGSFGTSHKLMVPSQSNIDVNVYTCSSIKNINYLYDNDSGKTLGSVYCFWILSKKLVLFVLVAGNIPEAAMG